MISLRPLAIDSPGTEVATPGTPAVDEVLHGLELGLRRRRRIPARRPASTPRSFAAAWAPSTICWMKGLPLRMGDEADLDRLGGRGRQRDAERQDADRDRHRTMEFPRFQHVIPPWVQVLHQPPAPFLALWCGPLRLPPEDRSPHAAVSPPSTMTKDPVMYEASSEARNATAPAISSGWAPRRIGMFRRFHSRPPDRRPARARSGTG